MPTKQPNGKYRARIRKDGRDFWLGLFTTFDEAASAERVARNRFPSKQGMDHFFKDRNSKGQFIGA